MTKTNRDLEKAIRNFIIDNDDKCDEIIANNPRLERTIFEILADNFENILKENPASFINFIYHYTVKDIIEGKSVNILKEYDAQLYLKEEYHYQKYENILPEFLQENLVDYCRDYLSYEGTDEEITEQFINDNK